MNADEYLSVLVEQIRCTRARKTVEEEIRSHIEDQKNDYIEKGMLSEEAEREAVRQMGDPVETGNALNKIHKPKMAWDMVALVLFLSVAGLVVQIFYNGIAPTAYPEKSIIYMFAGFGIMMVICLLDYSWIGKHGRILYFILSVFLFFRMIGICAGIHYYDGEMIRNTEALGLLIIPLYGAVLFQYRGGGYGTCLKCLLIAIPVLGMAFVSSGTTMVIIGVSFAALLTIAVLKGWFRGKKGILLSLIWGGFILPPCALLTALYQHGNAYQMTRIQSFFPSGAGFISLYEGKIRDALESASLLGKSIKVPMDWTILGGNDYTLLYIALYHGILTAVLLAGLMILLFVKGMHISFVQKNQLGMIIGIGCTVGFLIQFMLYFLYNIGMLPTASVYCPFITYEGSGILVTYAMLGLVLSVYRYQSVLGVRAG